MRRLSAVAALLAAVDTALLAYSALKGPYPGVVPLGDPTAYRSIYIHVPIAVTSYVLFALAAALAAVHLKTSRGFEGLAHSLVLVGLAYSAATLVTGSIWAGESWGSPWNWDPRETGVLFMFAAYIVYLVVRYSIKDPVRRSRVSMAYVILAFTTVPVSFALPYMAPSLHPVFGDTESFLRGWAAVMFGARIAVVLAAGLTLAVATRARASLAGAALVAVAGGLALAGYGVATYLSGETGTVVEASLEGGVLNATVYNGGSTLCVIYQGPSPVEPALIRLPDGSLEPAILGHTVSFEGGSGDGCIRAERLSILNHWGVYANLLAYTALAYGGSHALSRLARG